MLAKPLKTRKQRKEIKGRVKKVRGIAKAKAAAAGGKKKWECRSPQNFIIAFISTTNSIYHYCLIFSILAYHSHSIITLY